MCQVVRQTEMHAMQTEGIMMSLNYNWSFELGLILYTIFHDQILPQS